MAPNGTGIDKPSEWRGGGDAGWRVEMFAKDEQIRVLTARLAAAEDLLREAAIEWELGVDTCGMRQVRLPKEWYARTLKTGVLPAPAAKGVGHE